MNLDRFYSILPVCYKLPVLRYLADQSFFKKQYLARILVRFIIIQICYLQDQKLILNNSRESHRVNRIDFVKGSFANSNSGTAGHMRIF